LERSNFFAGPYSIADIAIFPWTRSHANQGVDLAEFRTSTLDEAIDARSAVQRGVKVLADRASPHQ